MSDLSVFDTAEGYEKVGVFTGQWGSTGFIARAVICDLSGCNSYDQTYVYVEIQYNTDVMSGYSWGTLRTIAGHEFGHAWSLAHVTTCDPKHLMYPYLGSCIGPYPQSHDIAAVNAIY